MKITILEVADVFRNRQVGNGYIYCT